MHLKRLIVAVLVLPVLYFSVVKLQPHYFLFILTLVTFLAQREFYAMYQTGKALAFTGIICGIVLLLSSSRSSLGQGGVVSPVFGYPLLFVLSFMAIASVRLFGIRDPSSALKDIAPAITGFLYIPTLLLVQWHLRQQGYEWILLLYGCVWASDSLAFYVGKGMGKRRLYPEVSPNKTVEGAFGSVIGGAVSAGVLGNLLFSDRETLPFLLIGTVIGGVTIVGDLVESMFKRDAGVKDSGSLIPGHGGILDKIDGALFAGPALFVLTLIA